MSRLGKKKKKSLELISLLVQEIHESYLNDVIYMYDNHLKILSI